MPPRYAYWTILIDNKPTAFRARDRDELMPTLAQLRRTNADVVMRWFARGRLWDSPEQAQWAAKNAPKQRDKRGRDWRPGGQHKDPRDRFKKKAARGSRDERRPRDEGKGKSRDDRKPRGGTRNQTRGQQRPWRTEPRGKGPRQFRPKGDRPRRHSYPPERRESEPPPPPARTEQPETPPRPEQIVIKPEPPERG